MRFFFFKLLLTVDKGPKPPRLPQKGCASTPHLCESKDTHSGNVLTVAAVLEKNTPHILVPSACTGAMVRW